MEISNLIKGYLKQGRIMQLATVDNGQPWICNVHYAHDDELNFYWLSLPTRRHSKEVMKNKKAAITIAVKTDKPVVGIQIEGSAEPVTEHAEIAKCMKIYVEKYNAGKDFYNNFVAGRNQHVMYKFTPAKFVLFDEVNFPKDGRQEWNPA